MIKFYSLLSKLKYRYPIILLVFFFTCELSAQHKIQISYNDVPVKSVLKEVTKQTGFSFVYSDDFLESGKRISVSLKSDNISLDNILKEVFKGMAISYSIQEKQVIIAPKSISLDKEDKAPQKENVSKNDIEISGIVREESGEALPGVTIVNLSTKKTYTSDIKGVFSFKANVGDKLQFRMMGMSDGEVVVSANQKLYEVVLKTDYVKLDNVVVTGYQTISKERATGSFGVISKEQIQRPTSNIGTRLVGTTSGVQVTLDSNGDPTFQVRGQSSLFANAKPLIVVDGFAIEGDFNAVNPNDVESITVLKDAAAASIWGARSANGVIVITTKNASNVQKGKVRVEINSFFKYSPKADVEYLLNVASPEDAIAFDRLSWGKWGGGKITDRELSIMSTMTPGKQLLNENNLGYLTTAQMESLLQKFSKQNNQQQIKDHLFNNPFTHQHNINIASSSDRSNNNLSLMYESRDMYLKGDSDERFMVSYRNNTRILRWLEFNFTGMFSVKDALNNSVGIAALKSIPSYELLLDEQGNRAAVYKSIYFPNLNRYWPMAKFPYPDLTYNPITEMEDTYKLQNTQHTRFQGGVTLNLLKGLKFNSQLQYENVNIFNKSIMGDKTFSTRLEIDLYTYWNRTDNTFTLNIPKGDILDQSRTSINTFTFRNQLDFNRELGLHSINLVAGMEMNRKVTQGFGYPRIYGYDDNRLSVGVLPNGVGSYSNANLNIYNWYGNRTSIYTNVNSTLSYMTDKYVSMFLNASYTYNGKYSLSASARTDASNLITDDPRYRYSPFWSVGLSWQLGKENALKDIDYIDRLVLRTTYGYNGNVDRSTSFSPLMNVYPNNNLYTNEPYATISSYGNPSLRWEKTGILNLGIDYSLFKGKVFGKIDYYYKNSKHLIASVSIPQINGVSSQKMNVANMTNKGIELEVGTLLPVYEDKISFFGNFNISYNKNRITKLYVANFTHTDLLVWDGGQGQYATKYVEGKDSKTIFGSNYAGLYNDGTETTPNWQPKIVDKNGVLIGFAGWPAGNVLDYAYEQGTTNAPWNMGLSFGFKVYDFNVSAIVTGKFGHVFRRTSYNYNGNYPNLRLNEVLNADPAKILPLPKNDNESRYYFWNRFWETFSYLTESASHLRFQELNITYNLNTELLKKLKLSNVQLYSQINNLFTLYANKYNEDPEYMLGSYKPTVGYTFGIRIGF